MLLRATAARTVRAALKRPIIRTISLLLVALLTLRAVATEPFDAGRADFSVRVDGFEIPYREFAVYVLPEEVIEIAAADIQLSVAAGNLQYVTDGRWQWRAPAKPGVTTIEVRSAESLIELNAVILHPASRAVNGVMSSYRIGAWPQEPLNGNPIYEAPDGFVEMTKHTSTLQLSPHFSIDQFPSKQSDAYPKYLVLREALIVKLEMLLERVNELGIRADTLTVMSGFRTPMYNHAIGNVAYSRHVYGGAADVYIDVAPRDGVMDDLNGDGVCDYRDAQFLYVIADEMFSRPENASLRGGLGVYRSNFAHGPFIHIDARGHEARWGLIPDSAP